MNSDLKRMTEIALEFGLTSDDLHTVIGTVDQVATQANLLARCMAGDTVCAQKVCRDQR